MTNWHNNNPIMTAKAAVSMADLIAHFTLNGSENVGRQDVRFDSNGAIFVRAVAGGAAIRDGIVLHQDVPMDGIAAERARGNVAEYSRNYFGAIVKMPA